MEQYDVIICGGGHNGLTCGAYLTKAGLNVLVLERLSIIGGGNITVEPFQDLKGYRLDYGTNMGCLIQANPMITKKEIPLEKFGCEYIYPDAMECHPFSDGSYLIQYRDVDRTCESIARISNHDAEAYKKVYQEYSMIRDQFVESIFSPPLPLSETIKQLEGTEFGRKFLKSMFQSPLDFVEERFESDKVKAWILWWGVQFGNRPDQEGTASLLYFMIGLPHDYGIGYVKGGAGNLSAALEKYIESNGGTVRKRAEVKKIIVKNGRAEGVKLTNGEEIFARKAVVANLHLKLLIPHMVGEENLTPSFMEQVKGFKPSPISFLMIHLATKEPPRFTASEELNMCSTFTTIDTVDKIMAKFDDIKKGNPFSEDVEIIGNVPTIVDPSRAPHGHHCIFLANFVPRVLKEGGLKRWDEIKEEVAERTLEKLRQYAPNFTPDNILGKIIENPLDLERRNPCVVQGDLFQGDVGFAQSGALRPLPGWSNYRMPIEGLYLCGPSTHPGPGASGGARAAAIQILKDLDIKINLLS